MKEMLPHIAGKMQEVLGSLASFAPEISLGILFVLLVFTDLLLGKRYKYSVPVLTLLGLSIITVLSVLQFDLVGKELFGGMLRLTRFAVLMKVLFAAGTLLVSIFALRDFRIRNNDKGWGEYFSLLTALQLGLHLMVMASNLLMVFLSLEMVSVCSYMLVGYTTRDRHATESAMKYILFGAVCSAIMLYGISLLYGLSGSLNLNEGFAASLAAADPAIVTLALFITLAGFGFKLSMFPFHFWVADVYQGSTNSLLALLSTLPKAAGVGLLIQFMHATRSFDWESWLAVFSIITMTVGNFQALWQENIKRMLAYSAIGHTGFLLMGLAAFSQTGEAAIYYYLLVYTAANIGAFMIIGLLANSLHSEELSTYKGLGFKLPLVSVCFVILLMSLIGIPPAGGFVAKLLIFSAAFEGYSRDGNILFLLMMIAGAVNTVVALFYYLKIPLKLFLQKGEGLHLPGRRQLLLRIFILLLSAVTLLLGIFPGLVMG